MKKLALLLFVATALAQKPELPEVNKLRLLSGYQKALIAQSQLQTAQANMNAAVQAFSSLTERTTEELKFPKGTTYQVDVDKQEVTVIQPKAEEKK